MFVSVGGVDVAGVSLVTGGVVSVPVVLFVTLLLPVAELSLVFAAGLAVAAPMSVDVVPDEAAVPVMPELVLAAPV